MAQSDINESRLLEPHELALLGPPGATRALPIDLIDPNPQNPRRAYAEIEDLAASIRQFGLLQPVTVRPNGERFELLGGHRRRLAYLMLADHEPHTPAWKVIEAVIKTFDDDTAYLALLTSQLQSRAWRPQEEAMALETLAATRTLRDVSKLVHKSERWVGQRLKVYADVVLSAYVQLGKLAPSIAQELLWAKDPAQRRALAERAVAEDWNQATARNEVRKLRASSMIAQIGRLSRDLLEALALIRDGSQIPAETADTLAKIRGRILALGRGAPVMPTIEAARIAAGVSDKPSTTRRRRPAGYVKGREPKR